MCTPSWMLPGACSIPRCMAARPYSKIPGAAAIPNISKPRRQNAILSGASIPVKIGGATVFVQVAQDLEHRDVLIDDIVREFFGRVGWITIPILLSLLVIDVSIFRKALSPLLKASDMAEEIGPERTDVRLPLEEMPSEIRPLVDTINQALERLERGFLVQRDFTADAAHELRTPLSILQARIDTIPDKAIAKELSRDIARMKRIVSQLLDIAELEAFSVGPDDSRGLEGRLRRCRGVRCPSRGRGGQADFAGGARNAGSGQRQCRGPVPRGAEHRRERDPAYAKGQHGNNRGPA